MSKVKLNADEMKSIDRSAWKTPASAAATAVVDLLASSSRDQLMTSRAVVILKDLLLSLRLPSVPGSKS